MGKNPDCDGDHCKTHGEVRLLPLGGGSNIIVCRACYANEMAFRMRRNKELDDDAKFPLPKWEDLKVYKEGN